MSDIDIVRWAFVRVLVADPDFNDPDYDGDRDLLIRKLHTELLSAPPERLLWLLHIEDLEFARRVHHLLTPKREDRALLDDIRAITDNKATGK